MTSLERWSDLCKRLGAGGDVSAVYARLAELHEGPRRAYHKLSHIEHCLDEFDDARELAEHPLEVEFAIWFHDAIYDPHANDNEERSAALAQETARDMGLADGFGARVADLILTSKHATDPQGTDAEIFVDIDLAILGTSEVLFDAYEKDIRKEYYFVPEMIFRVKRAQILRGFLDRKTIYSTAYFREKYERQARANIERSLARL
ncbi:MAG: N-methyl-D-aspartate receptor NMDAR2C subunit [Alphaproteobacteria bacterium]|jgi:predicted metal-dependent HD superfamily phosphohydrolase|nr:N-methyl-D-aspartate receptor NMDAR2C subunit [Alphaproteobacteria bacterium]